MWWRGILIVAVGRSILEFAEMRGQAVVMQGEIKLKRRIDSWRQAFTDDTHGVRRATEQLMNDYAIFMTTAEIVRMAAQRGSKSVEGEEIVQLNWMIFDLIRRGFSTILFLGIRKLTEMEALSGPRGVYSIRSVLADVKACRPKLTRRVYVELVCDCDYDVEEKRRQFWQEAMSAAGRAIYVDISISRSDECHRRFDILSGSTSKHRTESDLISPDFFHRLDSRLSALANIIDHANKNFAHAGSAESREGKNLKDFGTAKARQAIKEVKQLGELVGLLFAQTGDFSLDPCDEQNFHALDLPVVGSDEVSKLKTKWNDLEEEVESWSLSLEDLFRQE
jgi:hypothetical protein